MSYSECFIIENFNRRSPIQSPFSFDRNLLAELTCGRQDDAGGTHCTLLWQFSDPYVVLMWWLCVTRVTCVTAHSNPFQTNSHWLRKHMTLRCFWSFFNHFFETCLIFTFSTWWPLATVVRFRPEGACVQLSELRWWSGPKMPLFCRLVWSLIQRLECIYDIYVPNVTEFRKGPKTQVFIQTLKMVQQFQRMAWLTHDALLILLKSHWSPRSALPVWAVTSTSLPSSPAGILCLGRIGRRLGEGCFDIDHRHILSHHMRHDVDTPLTWTYLNQTPKRFQVKTRKKGLSHI